MKRKETVQFLILLLLATSCGGGTGTGGAFGSAETLSFEGWDVYRASTVPEDYDLAERLFNDALSVDPSFSDAHNGLGWINLKRAGQESANTEALATLLDRARSSFQRAIASDKGNADAWAGLSGLELAQNNWAAARDAGNRVLELEPRFFSKHDNIDFRDIHLILAQSLLNLSAFFETTASLDPNNSLFHIDVVEPGFRQAFDDQGLEPADLILKIEELQSR